MKQTRKFQLSFCTLAAAFALAVPSPASAQGLDFTRQEYLKSREMLSALSSGTLIVRLNSNHRKMNELERLASTPGLPVEKRRKFEKMLQTTARETRQESIDVLHAVNTFYNFSKVLYMYDTASFQLKNGVKSGYFLDTSLQVNPSIRLEDEDWLMIYFRHESPALFKLLDKNLEEVSPDFPIPKRPKLYYSKKYKPSRLELLENVALATLTGPAGIFMLYSRKNQDIYFSRSIYYWNKSLHRTFKRYE